MQASKLTTASRENWSSGEANRKRGRDWLDQIYKANHKSTENTLAAHRDFCMDDKPVGVLVISLLMHHSMDLNRDHLRPIPLRPHYS